MRLAQDLIFMKKAILTLITKSSRSHSSKTQEDKMSGKKQIRDLSCHKTKISLQAQENTKTIASGTKELIISNS